VVSWYSRNPREFVFLEFGKSNTLPNLLAISEVVGCSAEGSDEHRFGLAGRENTMKKILFRLRMTARRCGRMDSPITRLSGRRCQDEMVVVVVCQHVS